ncbi:MAG: hypothetical protein P8Z33_07515 [Gammaproteobacteria bacterium]
MAIQPEIATSACGFLAMTKVPAAQSGRVNTVIERARSDRGNLWIPSRHVGLHPLAMTQ